MKHKKAKEKRRHLKGEIKAGIMVLTKGMDLLKGLNYQIELESVYVPFLLLSFAFERLLKCILCLIFLDDNGNWIEQPFKYQKSVKGHDLVYLKERLISVITIKEILNEITRAKVDINFLQNDEALKLIIKALSDFGIGARYYNLGKVLEDGRKYEDPIITWDRVKENMLLITRGLDQTLKIPGNKRMTETYNDIIQILGKLIINLNKLISLAFTKKIAFTQVAK